MTSVERLAMILGVISTGLVLQGTATSGAEAQEIAADTIMNAHDEWELQRKRDEALAEGSRLIHLSSGYTIKLP